MIGEAIARSDRRVVLLASGALSHKFNPIDWVPVNPRIFHEDNVSSRRNVELDKEAVACMEEGRHDVRECARYRQHPRLVRGLSVAVQTQPRSP